MPKVSSKRQVTLPISDCEALGIHPGDEVEILRYGNQFNIIKREVGAAAGVLKHVKPNRKITDRESLMSNFN